MPKVYNRAKVNTSTTGTGTITLGSAVSGYQTFAAAGAANSDVVHYTIEEGINWEIGTGTYSSTGPTLTRTLVQSSTGSLLSLTGTAQVFITAPASSIQGGVEITGGTITGLSSAIPVASGGTGVATLTGLAKGNGTSAFSAAVAGTDYVAPAALSAYAPLASPTFTSGINIDNVDTTITRSAAGVIAVEGGVIPKENRANTFTSEQTTTIDNAPGFKARALSATAYTTVEAQANDYASGPSFTSTLIQQYGSTATGTTAGLSRASLGVLSFQNASAGLIGTNGGSPVVFMTTSLERMRIDSAGGVLITSNSLSIGNTDTTIARSAAGVIAVEGGVVPLENRANKFSAIQVVETTDANPALRITQLGTGLALYIEDSANPDASPFVVSAGGDVGIGAVSPSAKLDVIGPAGGTSLRLTDNTNSTLTIKHESPGNLVTYESGGVASQRWVTNSTERMRIDSSGNVGIGTASPASYGKLAVIGGSIYTDNALYSSDGTTTSRVISSGAVSYWGTTTNHPVAFQTNNIERMRINSTGDVLITSNSLSIGNADTTITRAAAGVIAVEGGNIPKENRANVFTASQTINGGNLALSSNTNFEPQTQLTHAGATAGSAPYYLTQRARGTYLAPTIVSSGDSLGQLYFAGHDGTTYRQAAAVRAVVDGTPGASDMPASLQFLTTPDGSATSLERFRVGPSGQLGIGGATYGTSGQVLTSGGAAAAPTWSTIPLGSSTVYTSGSGNYVVPANTGYVYVRMWGGGGSGGTYVSTSAAGGAGGAYKEEIYAVADLGGVGANVAYSVGAGGTAVAQGTAAGNPGGNTTFSSLTAHGGGGAVANSTGGTGAGYYGIGGFGGATSGQNSSDWGGAGGGASNSTTGGSAVYGGGGGGSRGNATATNGGPSIFGGRGGNCTLGVATGESGQVPGGGGASAGTQTGGTSGAGGAGRIEVYTW